MPSQGSSSSCGDCAYFTGSTDMTVKFPAERWTDTGIYYWAREIGDGHSLTFDATDTSWTLGAGTYWDSWRVFTMCAGASGSTYPHILEVSRSSSAKWSQPVFTLRDGKVKLYVHKTEGSVLSLESGTWDFTADSGTLLKFFNAEKGEEDFVTLKEGSSFKANTVQITPGAAVKKAHFLVEGGNHSIKTLEVGIEKDSSVTTPVVFEVSGGYIAATNAYIGKRTTTDDTKLLVNGDGTLMSSNLYVAASSRKAELTVSGSGAMKVDGTMNIANYAQKNNVTGVVTLAENAIGDVKHIKMVGVGGQTALIGDNARLELKDNADLTVSGFIRPNWGYQGGVCCSEIIVGDSAKLHATASDDSNEGGLLFGDIPGRNEAAAASVSRLVVKDNGFVETAARTTLGQLSWVSNVLEVCGNATFRNTNPSGIILGRGAQGRGYLTVSENGRLELTGATAIQLSGNLQWGDNLGSEERVDVLGGTIEASGMLSLGGTNAWVNLAGGNTAFGSWVVSGEPKYKVDDENWVLPTNTIHITGGKHTVKSATSIIVNATNGNARVWQDGGEVVASGTVKLGTTKVTGNPAMLTIAGGKFTIEEYGSNKDSQLKVGAEANSKGLFEFYGGELVANSIMGGNGNSTMIANGGKFSVLNAAKGASAICGLNTATLGNAGLEVAVNSGLTATNNQQFIDLEDASGLFTKSGKGKLVTIKESAHAKTVVSGGVMILSSGIKQFGRQLEIADGAFVMVTVPSVAGEYDVLTLDAELSDAELLRILPTSWAVGNNYEFINDTNEGVTTVKCLVTSGGDVGREIIENTTYSTHQRLVGYLRVTGGNIAVDFNSTVDIVGEELVIEVPAGSTVTFNAPIASVNTKVIKQGAGKVVFNSANPDFQGVWTQNGGTFDIRNGNFAAGMAGIVHKTDTIRYEGEEPLAVSQMITIDTGTISNRVVVETAGDVLLNGGINSLGGGIVKYGKGTLTISEPTGKWYLNSQNAAGNAGDNVVVTSLPENGASPKPCNYVFYGSKSGAGLQILSGAVKVNGLGKDTTEVCNQQEIIISTGYGDQDAEAGLEIDSCKYWADGSAKALNVGYSAASETYNHPYLKIRNSKFYNNRLKVAANSGTAKPIYPTVEIWDSTVTTDSGFQLGCNSDKCHPTMKLVNTQVTQYRQGYAEGHKFARNVNFIAMSNSVLNATYGTSAWDGFQFEEGASGTIKFTTGSKLQTALFSIVNTDATEENHVDLIFDGGILDVTTNNYTVTFAAPAYQGFTTEGEGMSVNVDEGKTVAFATPFRGAGNVVKVGEGTMKIAEVPDFGEVFRHSGATVIAEGALDLDGQAAAIPNLCGAGVVRNGTLKGSLMAKVGGKVEDTIQFGSGITFGRLGINVSGEAKEGDEIAIARVAEGGSEPTEEQIRTWKGVCSSELRAVGSRIEDGVIYANVVTKSGMVLILK